MSKCVLKHFTEIPQCIIDVIDEKSLVNLDIKEIMTISTVKVPIDFNAITLGKYIDIEEAFKSEENQLAVAYILLPNGTKFDIVEKKTYRVHTYMNVVNTYNAWKIALFEDFDDVIKKAKTTDKIDPNSNSWLTLAYSLSESITEVDSVLNMTLKEILFWLRMKKETK